MRERKQGEKLRGRKESASEEDDRGRRERGSEEEDGEEGEREAVRKRMERKGEKSKLL
jgi:hypothetical protein